MSVWEIRERARAAVGRLSGDVALTGPSERNGLVGETSITLSPDGRFVERFRGRVSTTIGFDGRRGWGLDMTGMPMPLDLENLETPRLVYAVVSGHWLHGDAFELELEPEGGDPRHVALHLMLRGGTAGATLLLDRTTWLPHRLERPFVGWPRIWEFGDYRTEHGAALPRRLTLAQGGLMDIDRLESLEAIATPAADLYRPITIEADDSRYDPSISPRIDLMKIHTGHVFVRPRIDGQEVGWLAFDTGSGAGFTLLPSVADRLGMPRFGRLAGGGAGSAIHVASLRQGRSFALGPVTISNSIYTELPSELNETMKRLAGIEVVGTCGYDLFRRCIVELDIGKTEALLHPRQGGPRVERWHDLTLQHCIPSLRCRFEGDRDGLFQLDTGAGPLVLFHSPTVERLRLLDGRAGQPMPVRGAAGTVDTVVDKLGWIEIAGERRSDVPAMFVTGAAGALADPHTDGTFGGVLLAPKKIVLDYGSRRMAVID